MNISEVYPRHQRHLRPRGDYLLPRPQVLLPPRALPLPGRPGAAHGGDGQAHERAQHVAHVRANFQVSLLLLLFYFPPLFLRQIVFSAISKRKGRKKIICRYKWDEIDLWRHRFVIFGTCFGLFGIHFPRWPSGNMFFSSQFYFLPSSPMGGPSLFSFLPGFSSSLRGGLFPFLIRSM